MFLRAAGRGVNFRYLHHGANSRLGSVAAPKPDLGVHGPDKKKELRREVIIAYNVSSIHAIKLPCHEIGFVAWIFLFIVGLKDPNLV
jgi:hypothetical protein